MHSRDLLLVATEILSIFETCLIVNHNFAQTAPKGKTHLNRKNKKLLFQTTFTVVNHAKRIISARYDCSPRFDLRFRAIQFLPYQPIGLALVLCREGGLVVNVHAFYLF